MVVCQLGLQEDEGRSLDLEVDRIDQLLGARRRGELRVAAEMTSNYVSVWKIKTSFLMYNPIILHRL